MPKRLTVADGVEFSGCAARSLVVCGVAARGGVVMQVETVTGWCRDWQGRYHRFRFSWASDAGIEWGNLYLDKSQRPEVLGFERLRSMEASHCDAGQAFPPAIGPPAGWDETQQQIGEVETPTGYDIW
jgi:hypothetical protein